MCKPKGESTAFPMITDLPLASEFFKKSMYNFFLAYQTNNFEIEDGICDTHGIHLHVTVLITKIVQVEMFDDELI